MARSGEKAPPAEEAQQPAQPFSGEVLCFHCGRYEHHTKVRLLSKKAGTFRCRGCGVKATQLARHLGQWPLPSFANLALDERQAFVRSIDGLPASLAAQRASEYLERFETLTQDLWRWV